MTIEPATIEDLVAVADEPREFWGERDLPALHHPLLIHEFGELAFVTCEDGRRVVAYLFGLLTPARVGYIHLVAVREGHRRAGLARALYERFAEVAEDLGATSLKAFTQPVNTTSIAFHRSMGFLVSEVSDYAGPGELRVVFTRELGGG